MTLDLDKEIHGPAHDLEKAWNSLSIGSIIIVVVFAYMGDGTT
jgi:hypothetical protein